MFPLCAAKPPLKTNPFSVETETTSGESERVMRAPLAVGSDFVRVPAFGRRTPGRNRRWAVSIEQDGADRRRAPRASCRLHCRVLAGKERTRARIVDVSDGGLCLLSPTWLASKSKIHISIDVPNRGESIVEAQVWHVRRQKMHGGTRKVWAIGVMLEGTDESYQRLLLAAGVAPDTQNSNPPEPGRPTVSAAPRAAAKPAAAAKTDSAVFRRRSPSTAAAPASPVPSPTTSRTGSPPAAPLVSAEAETEMSPEDLFEPKIFRIRVKAVGGPRTKVLTLAAESEEEARTLATRDLEARWTVMDVRAA